MDENNSYCQIVAVATCRGYDSSSSICCNAPSPKFLQVSKKSIAVHSHSHLLPRIKQPRILRKMARKLFCWICRGTNVENRKYIRGDYTEKKHVETLLEGHEPIRELGPYMLGLVDSDGDEEAWVTVADIPSTDITVVVTQTQGITHATAHLSVPSFRLHEFLPAATFRTTLALQASQSTAINPRSGSFVICPIV